MLNNANFPDYFIRGRLVPLSKKVGQKIVELQDIRPIVIKPHLVKICEKAIESKIDEVSSSILESGEY
jgi:uncharacterized membrane-anchored protein YjiN (DUF445 family)